jgi:MoxR-like ATPase
MLTIKVGYNTREEELMIAKRVANGSFETVNPVVDKPELFAMREEVKKVHIDAELEEYMISLVFATREPNANLQYGASPRASIDLYKAAKGYAYLHGKDHVTPSDIARATKDVLRHRLILSYEGEAEGITSDDIVNQILSEVPIP